MLCGYSLESHRQGVFNEYPQHMFLWRNKQNYPLIITNGADAQPDLSLHWAHRSFCWFCHAAALSHILDFFNLL